MSTQQEETTLSPDSFKVLLKKLAQKPDEFEAKDVAQCFRHLCKPDGTGATPAQIGSFITALTLSGLDSSPEVVAACAAVLREHSVQVKDIVSTGDKSGDSQETQSVKEEEWDYSETDKIGDGYKGVVDIVGTGGDGFDTYNVSTTAAVVVAGTGLRVAKHGSKAATSTSGSADLLMSLGASLTYPPEALPTLIQKSPFLFLFAPHYHPSLAHLAPIRRELNFRTIFNVLGPLINPVRPQRMVLGVARKELGETFIQVLKLLKVERALVVCGKEGLDEISCEGETWTWELNNDDITTGSIHPTTDFGLATHPISSVRGSTPELNSLTFHSILDASLPAPSHLSAPASVDSPSLDSIRDYVLLQSAALLKISGRVETYKEGVDLARKSMEQGGAVKAWEGFKTASNEAMKGVKARLEDDGGVAAKGGDVPAWLHSKKATDAAKEDKKEEDK